MSRPFALKFSVNRSFADPYYASVSRSALYGMLVERATYKELNEKCSSENINEGSKRLLLRARAREYDLFGQQLFAS